MAISEAGTKRLRRTTLGCVIQYGVPHKEVAMESFCATIAVTRHKEPDSLVQEVLRSATMQTGVVGEVLFLDQQREASPLDANWSSEHWEVRRHPIARVGLSVARNEALRLARHDCVLFLDADALAEPRWALGLCKALAKPSVAVAGGRIDALWSGNPPVWARSQVVRDQYSLYDLGPETHSASRIVGAGFGVRKSACPNEIYFNENLGRRDGGLFGGEESELCARVISAGGRVVYVGAAAVQHVISIERKRLAWVWKRLFYAGHGRAVLGGIPTPSRRLILGDWLLMPMIVPPYVAGWLFGRLLHGKGGSHRRGSPTQAESD